MKLFHPSNEIGRLASLCLIATVCMWVYYFATRLMKVPETAYIDKTMARLAGKLRLG